ncbi:hypothetical protein [Micromonospora sp. NBC_01796]|uniref:hypothetical protein n=1 Tax=Micromonospora sp. NBC_01796 TaxID=2975987 RepID=UPI002DD820B6|nr:hypothetical protein [Micromonospora sp. NBC_01796]WSA88019.1 hypothetical protein OIE47_10625 [Micromonospora sp. NBC_01796]
MTDDDPAALHVFGDAGWRCRDDGDEWPCQVYRRRFRHHYGPDVVGMIVFMHPIFEQAVLDLPTVPTKELRARFLGWCRRPHIGSGGG